MQRSWRGRDVVLAMAPAMALFLVFLVAPLAATVYQSTFPHELIPGPRDAHTYKNYTYFVSRGFYVSTLWRTLRIALVTTLISLTLGYTLCLVLRRRAHHLGATFVLALSFPILGGPIVTVLGWMVMLSSGGVVGGAILWARRLLGFGEGPFTLLGSETAVVTGLVHFTVAFVVLNLLNSFLRMDRSLEEAAMNLGARPWQTFRYVIWPLSLPGVLSASLIAFSLCVSAFVNPYFLGGEAIPVVTTLISQLMLTSFNWQMASTTAIILLAVSLGLVVAYHRLLWRAIR